MALTPHRAAALLLIFFAASASAQVIFSRRVYKEHGASHLQIYTWNPTNGDLKALTNSARDHYDPTCDGRAINFISPDPAIAEFDHARLWNLNPVTGEETVMGPVPEVTGAQGSPTPSCDRFAKRGELEACGNEELLVVSRSRKQIGRFQIQINTCAIDNRGTVGKCETPIRSLDWTEDGKWLLIGEEGLNDSSTSRQNDYHLLNLTTMKISTVASAENAFWLPARDQIVYLTPRDLMPLPDGSGKHNVWVQQLMFFDPVRNLRTTITSGLANNVDPSWCESTR